LGFPSSKEEWHSILEQITSGHSLDNLLLEEIQNCRLWETEGAAHVRSFSPSDIKAVVDTAYLNAVHEFLDRSDNASTASQDAAVTIQMHHMVKALQSTRPSLSREDRRMLNQVYRQYTSAADLSDDENAPMKEPTILRTALK